MSAVIITPNTSTFHYPTVKFGLKTTFSLNNFSGPSTRPAELQTALSQSEWQSVIDRFHTAYAVKRKLRVLFWLFFLVCIIGVIITLIGAYLTTQLQKMDFWTKSTRGKY